MLLPSLTNRVFAEVLRGIESVTDAHNTDRCWRTMATCRSVKKSLTSLLSYNIDGLTVERHHTPRTLK